MMIVYLDNLTLDSFTQVEVPEEYKNSVISQSCLHCARYISLLRYRCAASVGILVHLQ